MAITKNLLSRKESQKMTIKELILISDLDGTILPPSGVISQENIAAIEKFRKLGGTFAVATGRAPIHAKYLCDIIGVSDKVICNNGACIYDMDKMETVWSQTLDSHYLNVLKYILETHPQVGIQAISTTDEFFVVNNSSLLKKEILSISEGFSFVKIDELPDNICKVLFLIEGNDFFDICADILAQDFDAFEFVASGGACFEMMHKGISKGFPLEKLANFYGKQLSNVAAIGDYFNDIDMLKKAHFSAAIANSPPEVLEAANIVVKSCDQHGVADFIDVLINKFGTSEN